MSRPELPVGEPPAAGSKPRRCRPPARTSRKGAETGVFYAGLPPLRPNGGGWFRRVGLAQAWLLAAGLVLPSCTGRAAVPDGPPPTETTSGETTLPSTPAPTSTTTSIPTTTSAESQVPASSETDTSRLLTGLSAVVAPEGVTLRWTVDESRADRITGFSCVFRTPGHITTGVSGAVPCHSEPEAAGARSMILTDLPEYGDYDFEVVALIAATEDIVWSERALRLRQTVAEDLAGPPGPGRAVGISGPLVEACGPAYGAGERPWRLDQIVSAAHVTHYPGRAWAPGGDPAAAPDWPEPPSLTDLFFGAGLDAEPLQQVLGGAPDGPVGDQAAAVLADPAAAAVLARVSARTKALLRTSSGGGHDLRLHTSYPFGADYLFEASHAVAGWGNPGATATQAALWHRTECPPPGYPDAIHDVALALSHAAGNGTRLEHSGYGWWAVAPVGLMPERIVATKGGLSYGTPASEPPAAATRWQGRVSGHLFWDQRRWALAGDLTLELEPGPDGGEPALSGHIDNVVLAALDPDSLAPLPGPATPWRSLALGAAVVADDGAWSGLLSVGASAEGEPEGMPAPDVFVGDWRAGAYGADGTEIAGRLRLWTPLPDGADPGGEWPRQVVLVAGFGGRTP